MVSREQLDGEERRAACGRALVVEPASQELLLRAPAELPDRTIGDGSLAKIAAARRSLEVVAPGRAKVRELALRPGLRELVCLRCGLCKRHAGTPAAARMESTALSTSRSVARQFETEIRIACSPSQSVPLSQHVPSCCTRAITSRVCSPSPNRTSTWLRTTSLSTVAPPASSAAAKRRAFEQHRSIISAMPLRPSERMAA